MEYKVKIPNLIFFKNSKFKKENNEIINFLKKYKSPSKKKIKNKNYYNIINNQINLSKLFYLYKFTILNKRTTILEFGSGPSSLIFLYALNKLKISLLKKTKKLRRNNLFELFCLEQSKFYLKFTKNKIKEFYKLKKNCCKINLLYSKVKMNLYKNLIVNSYNKLPLCNPDLIYIDGPDQFDVYGKVNGITTNHPDFLPISSDILKIEHFLIPGTIILCDGRGAQVDFLKCNLKRKWFYKKLNYDQHMFLLKSNSFGFHNENLLKFYNN